MCGSYFHLQIYFYHNEIIYVATLRVIIYANTLFNVFSVNKPTPI